MTKNQSGSAVGTAAQKWLKDPEAAAYLGVAVGTLRKWRYANKGPRGLRICASVRYKVEDLDNWLATRPSFGGVE